MRRSAVCAYTRPYGDSPDSSSKPAAGASTAVEGIGVPSGLPLDVAALDRMLTVLPVHVLYFDAGLLCRYAAPAGLQFLGRRQDVPVLLRRADVFLLTSEHEGFPNVLLEAMAARLPVVTTPAGDAGRLVKDGTTGYVVSFNDVQGMVQRVLQLAKSPPLRQRFGGAGRQQVEERYSYVGLPRCLLATYRAIAAQQHHRRALRACLSYSPPTVSAAGLQR